MIFFIYSMISILHQASIMTPTLPKLFWFIIHVIIWFHIVVQKCREIKVLIFFVLGFRQGCSAKISWIQRMLFILAYYFLFSENISWNQSTEWKLRKSTLNHFHKDFVRAPLQKNFVKSNNGLYILFLQKFREIIELIMYFCCREFIEIGGN